MINIIKSHWKKALSVLTLLVLFLFIYNYKDDLLNFMQLLKHTDEVSIYIKSFGPLAGIIFILLQVLQVVIFFIPGEFIQAAGGYAFGTWIGTLYSIIGISLGSSILFFATRRFGHNFVEKVLPKKVKKSFKKIFNSKRINLIVFLVYLIPGFPKDSLAFLAGVSKIDFRSFIIYSTLGRLPALFLSSYYGANIASGKKFIIIMLSVVFILVIGVGIRFKSHFFSKLEEIE